MLLPKRHSYEKRTSKTLMQLTPGITFTNITNSFFKQYVLLSFSFITLGFVIFWRKEIGTKAARKILVKLTIAENTFIYVLFIYFKTFFLILLFLI